MMADRYPWWKSLTGRKKNNVPSESAVKQEAENEVRVSEKASVTHDVENNNNNNKSSSFLHGHVYTEPSLEPAFNEHTSRRSLWVSRSGRFKEKRRVRGTLPENNNFYETTTAVAK